MIKFLLLNFSIPQKSFGTEIRLITQFDFSISETDFYFRNRIEEFQKLRNQFLVKNQFLFQKFGHVHPISNKPKSTPSSTQHTEIHVHVLHHGPGT